MASDSTDLVGRRESLGRMPQIRIIDRTHWLGLDEQATIERARRIGTDPITQSWLFAVGDRQDFWCRASNSCQLGRRQTEAGHAQPAGLLHSWAAPWAFRCRPHHPGAADPVACIDFWAQQRSRRRQVAGITGGTQNTRARSREPPSRFLQPPRRQRPPIEPLRERAVWAEARFVSFPETKGCLTRTDPKARKIQAREDPSQEGVRAETGSEPYCRCTDLQHNGAFPYPGRARSALTAPSVCIDYRLAVSVHVGLALCVAGMGRRCDGRGDGAALMTLYWKVPGLAAIPRSAAGRTPGRWATRSACWPSCLIYASRSGSGWRFSNGSYADLSALRAPCADGAHPWRWPQRAPACWGA